MDLLHVFHFESAGEELRDMVDICYVLSSIDQAVHIYYDKQMSFGVTPDEHGIVGLGHFETDLVKILGYLRVPCSRCLLETVERLFESADRLRVCGRLESGRF